MCFRADKSINIIMRIHIEGSRSDYDITGMSPKELLSFLPTLLTSNRSTKSLCFTVSPWPKEFRPRDCSFDSTRALTSWTLASYYDIKNDEAEQKRKGFLGANETEKCSICLCEFEQIDEGAVVKLSRCTGHYFHIDCIERYRERKDAMKCPVCQVIYGQLTGNMPDGVMQVELYPRGAMLCEGYPRAGVIQIKYSIPSGRLNHRVMFQGTSRQAYLPDTPEGREVLALLVIAFSRRHTFAVGTSVTTGKTNTVVWAGIHHKTGLTGGTRRFGYPDPTYFSRVKEEMAARGVMLE